MLIALLKEYKKSTIELKNILSTLSESLFIKITDDQTSDPDCRSIQAITSHMVQSGYTYANYINAQSGTKWVKFSDKIETPKKGIEEIEKMLAFTESVFDEIWYKTNEEIEKWQFNSSWKVIYDFEQLMEHAIVHILRHRRQIENVIQAHSQNPNMINALFETHLFVENLQRSIDFYTNKLGLEQCYYEEERKAAFFWIGQPKQAMLGLWEKPKADIDIRHFAFECEPEWVKNESVKFLKDRDIEYYNFLRDGSKKPMVFAWTPAISIYFNDPDGHSLEFIGLLKGVSKPENGIISYEKWLELETI